MTRVIALPEIVVPGRRLGRHINHDPTSLLYALPEAATVQSVEWTRHTPILDQGDVSACTGNALTGALGTGRLYDALVAEHDPDVGRLDEAFALAVYSAAETLDGDGPYPPNDNGSSGLSVAKVALRDGYIAGYQHATSVAAAHTAIQAGAFIQGSYWLTGMDEPSSEGIVTATGTARGGHEYMCRQYDAARDLWWYDNSWGLAFGVAGRFAMDTPTLTKLLDRAGDITSLVPVTSPPPVPTPTVGRTWTAASDAGAQAVRTFVGEPHVYRVNTAAAKALAAGRWS